MKSIFNKQTCFICIIIIIVILVIGCCQKYNIKERFLEKTIKTGTESDEKETFSVEESIAELNDIQKSFLSK